jgi:hypothetical protein
VSLMLSASADDRTNLCLLQRMIPLIDAVDGSSTGTRVPKMWALLRLPRFGGAIHANDHEQLVSTSQSRFQVHGVDVVGQVVIRR